MFGVSVRTFALFIVLAALLGFYTVYQKSARTSAQYKLVKLLQEEKRLDEEVVRANNRLAVVVSPDYLDKMNDQLKLGMEPLRKYRPGIENEKKTDLVSRTARRKPAAEAVAVGH